MFETDETYYGLPVIQFNDFEYAVALTEEKANAAIKEYVETNLWLFTPESIEKHSRLSLKTIKYIQKLYENGNEALIATIDMDNFIENQITESFGEYLSPVDQKEFTLGDIRKIFSEEQELEELLEWVKSHFTDENLDEEKIFFYKINEA